MMKLDPYRADNPLVWSNQDQGTDKSGVWGRRASPANR